MNILSVAILTKLLKIKKKWTYSLLTYPLDVAAEQPRLFPGPRHQVQTDYTCLAFDLHIDRLADWVGDNVVDLVHVFKVGVVDGSEEQDFVIGAESLE